MSLRHNYLQTLPSERRQVARFPTVQDQLNRLRDDLSLLTDTVEKLIELHDKEHPDTAVAIATTTATEPEPAKPNIDNHSPYH